MQNVEDPFQLADTTSVVRPRPGGGRRVADPSRSSRPAAPLPSTPAPVALPEGLGTGLNPLVQAATPCLLLTSQLRATTAAADVAALRRHALDEVRKFEGRAREKNIRPEVVKAARYALCAALDEAALSTPWGTESGWAQQSLLVELHREAVGGERFFEMLEQISKEPRQHINLLELQYLCMTLGFAGRYLDSERGLSELRELQRQTFQRIGDERGAPEPALSLRWRGIEDRRNPVIRYVPWWILGAAALAIVAITFAILSARLRDESRPVQEALGGIGSVERLPLAAAPATGGASLKQLLAAEEASGAIAVEERGNQTWITPRAVDLFASGSADVNTRHAPTLQRVAAAINQVPGRVVITGHTDDQPLRSSRFADNFELSRERAVSVARQIQQSLGNPGRVAWNGVGSSRPLFTPASTPENRARNRRVEITHLRDR